MNKILELKEVSYLYSQGTPFAKVALNKINISFERGKITGLIGHTGSGQSTLVGRYPPVQIRPAPPKQKALRKKCFLFWQ